MIAGVINGHVAAKYIYVRLFRGTDRMQKRSFLSIGSWVGISLVLWVVAWVIAEAIPVFNNLLSLIVSSAAIRRVQTVADLIDDRRPFSRVGLPVSSPAHPFQDVLSEMRYV